MRKLTPGEKQTGKDRLWKFKKASRSQKPAKKSENTISDEK